MYQMVKGEIHFGPIGQELDACNQSPELGGGGQLSQTDLIVVAEDFNNFGYREPKAYGKRVSEDHREACHVVGDSSLVAHDVEFNIGIQSQSAITRERHSSLTKDTYSSTGLPLLTL